MKTKKNYSGSTATELSEAINLTFIVTSMYLGPPACEDVISAELVPLQT